LCEINLITLNTHFKAINQQAVDGCFADNLSTLLSREKKSKMQKELCEIFHYLPQQTDNER
jgi:hypothetical protein